jgi:hypothetical protein
MEGMKSQRELSVLQRVGHSQWNKKTKDYCRRIIRISTSQNHGRFNALSDVPQAVSITFQNPRNVI